MKTKTKSLKIARLTDHLTMDKRMPAICGITGCKNVFKGVDCMVVIAWDRIEELRCSDLPPRTVPLFMLGLDFCKIRKSPVKR